MIHNIKIIHSSPTQAEFFLDDMQLKAVVSYQVNASCTDRPTITIVMQADIEIKKEYDNIIE